MFILTKLILVSFSVKRTGYLFTARISSKKIILGLNELVRIYAVGGHWSESAQVLPSSQAPLLRSRRNEAKYL